MTDIKLDAQQAVRFGGHIMLKEIGGAGQAALRRARVLIIGVGGLGNPLAQALCGAGVGALRLVDGDAVSLSNLHRQFLFEPDDIDLPKAEVAARKLTGQFPDTKIVPINRPASPDTIAELLHDIDLVVDGSDNFATRYTVSDACFYAAIPYISGAIGQFDAQIGNFQPHLMDANGVPYPSYRCLVPAADAADAPPCATQGVVGAFTGLVGNFMALEAIREITGAPNTLVGKLQIVDGRLGTSRIVRMEHDPANPLTGSGS